jgi:hypothetical protein
MRCVAGVRVALRLALALCVANAPALRAAATTFIQMDERDLAARAEAAVIATVIAVRTDAEADGAIVTTVVLEPEQTVLGVLPPGPITLRERGGFLSGRSERVFGSVEYQVGERVLAFLSRAAGGGLRTTAMAMGKYRLDADGTGAAIAERAFGEDVAVLDPASGGLHRGGKIEIQSLAALMGRLGVAAPSPAPAPPRSLRRTHHAQRRVAAPQHFTYLGEPSRWFEPDEGIAVRFAIDASGDAIVGRHASLPAAVDALAAWSGVEGTGLRLSDAVLEDPLPYPGCDGDTRVVFNDPFDDIDDPVDCRGVLGIGGFCYSDETRTVNGTTFKRIRVAKVTLANGWEHCGVWTACNLAELLTHEIGHALGIGHSGDNQATMWPVARFDGRCANVAGDDAAAVRFIYPRVAPPTPTPTFTVLPSATPTATATRTRTATPSRKPTSRPPGRSVVSGRIRYHGNDLPVSGVSVALRGAGDLHRTSTTANGQYVFPDVADGRWAIEPSRSGAIGGAISALDAAWVLQTLAGRRTMTEMQRTACAVSGNGVLSALDATRILQVTVGELERLPAATLCQSDWLFMPDPEPTPGQSMAMPRLRAGDCTRGAVVLDPLQGTARDQDLRAGVFGDCTGNWTGEGGDSVALLPASAGTAIEMQRLRRRPGGRWLQPIAVRAPADVYALELELRYDATRLELGRVRTVHLGDAAIARARSSQPGRLTIALASAEPLPNDGRAALVVEFTSGERDISPRLVRPFTAAVDERLVIGR